VAGPIYVRASRNFLFARDPRCGLMDELGCRMEEMSLAENLRRIAQQHIHGRQFLTEIEIVKMFAVLASNWRLRAHESTSWTLRRRQLVVVIITEVITSFPRLRGAISQNKSSRNLGGEA
jgi:hypothetical protein